MCVKAAGLSDSHVDVLLIYGVYFVPPTTRKPVEYAPGAIKLDPTYEGLPLSVWGTGFRVCGSRAWGLGLQIPSLGLRGSLFSGLGV